MFGEPKEQVVVGSLLFRKKEHFYSVQTFEVWKQLKSSSCIQWNFSSSTGEMLNATTGSAGLLIKNPTHYYESNYHTGSAEWWFIY